MGALKGQLRSAPVEGQQKLNGIAYLIALHCPCEYSTPDLCLAYVSEGASVVEQTSFLKSGTNNALSTKTQQQSFSGKLSCPKPFAAG
jgi:hypothetical protein